MQNIVKDRLPKFTKEEIKIVQGSADMVGINQYTAYYMQHVAVNESVPPGYQKDWHVGYVCKLISSIFIIRNLNVVAFALMNVDYSADAKNGVPIGPKVSLIDIIQYNILQ